MKKMEYREKGHNERGMPGGGMKSMRSSGSPAHRNERVGPGEVPGAGEMTMGSMPGAAAMRVRVSKTENPSRMTPTGKAPKGMKIQTEGE